MRRAHVFASGLVQGVFFRVRAAQKARAAGCGGWVQNLPDGRVEAVFEGSSEEVGRLVAWAREGPEHAVVRDLEVLEEEPEGLERFEIRG